MVRSFKSEVEVKALFNTGASFTVVRKSLLKKVGHILPTNVKETTLSDGKLSSGFWAASQHPL